MSDNEIILCDETPSLSQVADPSAQKVSKTMRYTVLAIILVMFGLLYAAGKSHSRHQEARIDAKNALNPYALQENLDALERMQQEASQKHARHTTTDDGKKIGNHNAFREALPVEAPIDAELATRMNAPTTFINVDEPALNHTRKNPELAAPLIAGHDANSAFLNAKNSIDSVDAVALPHPEHTLSAGEFIPATLETAINSDLPGMVRALTARDVYALTGQRILIPKGSRLIGQYSSGNIGGVQTRILISWTRVQLPSGVVVTLNSPSADALGRGGQGADSIDSHVVERFSSALLFSVLGASTAIIGVAPQDDFNSATAYRMELANGLQQTARDNLQKNRAIQPTLHLDQGAAINVFVARDLNFYHVARK